MSVAKLIIGEDYVLNGVHFKNGVDVKIDDDLKVLLEDNEQFEITEEIKEEPKKDDKKGKGQQEGEA